MPILRGSGERKRYRKTGGKKRKQILDFFVNRGTSEFISGEQGPDQVPQPMGGPNLYNISIGL